MTIMLIMCTFSTQAVGVYEFVYIIMLQSKKTHWFPKSAILKNNSNCLD